MAIKDITRKPYIEDNDENVFIGIDLPFRKSDGIMGWFASSSTTIDSVKNNIKNLLLTEAGERIMQPNLGLALKKYLFEQSNPDIKDRIQQDIIEAFRSWLPFVQIRELNIILGDNQSNQFDVNTINIKIIFNITRDPNTLESVSVTVTGE